MKISDIENRAYCWRDQNGGWQVGKPLVDDCDCVVLKFYDKDSGERSVEALMLPSHASPPTWVRLDDLQPYPSEPIEEPSVKGGVA